ncbi:MAG: flippase-like domain-containing protein [Candidatus Omnitrophica bacterium]|nr:flippase-like domain-containing protein [Candidatus Omnitrophota bacterium]
MDIFKRDITGIVLRVLVSISILIFLFLRIEIKDFLKIVGSLKVGLLFLAFLFFLISHILWFWRWRIILKALNVDFNFHTVLSSFAAGLFFNLVLPSTLGGDFLRITDFSQKTKRPKEIISSVFLDRLSGYVGLELVLIISLIFGYHLVNDKNVFLVVSIFSFTLIFLLFLLFNSFLYSKINRFLHLKKNKFFSYISALYDCVYYFKRKKGMILKNLFLSLAIQLLIPLVYFIIALALGKTINWIYFFIFIPVISVIIILPLSIGGLGLREMAMVYFFSQAGLPKDISLVVSLIGSVFLLIVSCLGGIIYASMLHTGRIQHNQKFRI